MVGGTQLIKVDGKQIKRDDLSVKVGEVRGRGGEKWLSTNEVGARRKIWCGFFFRCGCNGNEVASTALNRYCRLTDSSRLLLTFIIRDFSLIMSHWSAIVLLAFSHIDPRSVMCLSRLSESRSVSIVSSFSA